MEKPLALASKESSLFLCILLHQNYTVFRMHFNIVCHLICKPELTLRKEPDVATHKISQNEMHSSVNGEIFSKSSLDMCIFHVQFDFQWPYLTANVLVSLCYRPYLKVLDSWHATASNNWLSYSWPAIKCSKFYNIICSLHQSKQAMFEFQWQVTLWVTKSKS